MSNFDPYREWLEIDPVEQPADHYRLLGLARFENDRSRIERAADERMAHVRQFQTGPRGPFTQKLLNELAAARLCLLDAQRKTQYDAELGARILATQAAGRAAATPLPAPFVPSVPLVSAPVTPGTARQSPQSWQGPLILASCLLAILFGLGGWAIGRWRTTGPAANQSGSPDPLPESSLKPAPPVVQPSPDGSLEFIVTIWTPREHTWQFHVYKPGFFQAEVSYATAESFGDGQLELQIDDRRRQLTLRNTGGLAQTETDSVTVAVPRFGRHSLTVRAVGSPGTDQLIVRRIRFLPVERDITP
jgi:hypothetical protein